MNSATLDLKNPTTANDWRFAVIGLMALLVFASFTYVYQYRNGFAEVDVYWIAMGLLDGATSGLKTSSPMQYEITIGFGFYETFHALFSQATLTDSERLTIAINNFGWISAISAMAALWLAISLIDDKRTATIVATLFGLNAVFLEASTSGHPFLFSSALLFLGASFLWAPAAGMRRIAYLVAAAILCGYSLTVRADGFLAFPWLVLMHPNLRNVKSFVSTTLSRALPLVAALIVFFLLQSFYADVPHGPGAIQGSKNALIDFFRAFYRPDRIAVGSVYAVLTLGIATTFVTLAAILFLLARVVRSPIKSERIALIGASIGIAALLLPNLIFWLPIPTPPRHFSFSVIACGLCLAEVARKYNIGPMLVAVLLVALISANELLSELSRPKLLKQMAMVTPEFGSERLTHPYVPIGFIWLHHRSLQAAATIQNTAAEQLAAACNQKIVFTSGNGGLSFGWIPPFFRLGRPIPQLSWGKTGNVSNLTIHHGDRDLILAFSYEIQLDRQILEILYPDALILWPRKISEIGDLLKQVPRKDCSER